MSDYDLISARSHYLHSSSVVGFTDFFVEYLLGRTFDPPYLTRTYRPKCQYVITSLEDAWEQYAQEFNNMEALGRIRCYQEPLREAVRSRDDQATADLIGRIFDKKLIASNNVDWLAEHRIGLAELLSYASEMLTDDSPQYTAFGRPYGPRMSASFSRIYAILIGEFLTYESRVAAGLCFMVRSYCQERGIDLPSDLQFGRIQGWGKGKKDNRRNASWGTNEFPSIDTIKKKPARESAYARTNILASWLVVEAVHRAQARRRDEATFWLHGTEAMRRIEGALFMLGAELPTVANE